MKKKLIFLTVAILICSTLAVFAQAEDVSKSHNTPVFYFFDNGTANTSKHTVATIYHKVLIKLNKKNLYDKAVDKGDLYYTSKPSFTKSIKIDSQPTSFNSQVSDGGKTIKVTYGGGSITVVSNDTIYVKNGVNTWGSETVTSTFGFNASKTWKKK